ncbi:hypothetical protein [Nonomuraea fuscirosea]|uniref:hypothetical protein n=1 Tax=Nonomuraea fuscirosea TaxID=1291556 RepID=UPI00340C6EDB
MRTSTVYVVDGVAARLGPDLIGLRERSSSIEEMRASERLHFVKTHRQRGRGGSRDLPRPRRP